MLAKRKKGSSASPFTIKSCAIFILVILVLVTVVTLFDTKLGSIIININNNISSITNSNSTSSYKPQRQGIMAHIVLVENRDLQTEKSYGYYTFAMWKLYCSILYRNNCNLHIYNSSNLCSIPTEKGGMGCMGYNGTIVSPYWMKVLAVQSTMMDLEQEEVNENDLIIFVDADMQIINANFTLSIFELTEVQSFLHSDDKHMLVIDERSASFWYRTLHEEPNGYDVPIVSNLFMVKNNNIGRQMIHMWWKSMVHSTPWDESGTKMAFGWPFEQERLAAYYNSTPQLFYPVRQSWIYFGFLHHGPLCCIGFSAKHDIIRSLNETLMNQTRTLLPKLLATNITSYYDADTTYEELVSDLYHQLNIKTLTINDNNNSSINNNNNESWRSKSSRQQHGDELVDFWNIWD